VSLVGNCPAVGVATTYEFVLQASWSVVTLQPVISSSDDVRIRLDVDGYRIDVCRGGVSTLISQGKGRRPRHLSVRTLLTFTAVVVRIGDATVVIDFPVGGATTDTRERGVDLIGARLCSLDQTSTTFPHHPVEAVKEQK
jgi:predicted RNase H-like nuclease